MSVNTPRVPLHKEMAGICDLYYTISPVEVEDDDEDPTPDYMIIFLHDAFYPVRITFKDGSPRMRFFYYCGEPVRFSDNFGQSLAEAFITDYQNGSPVLRTMGLTLEGEKDPCPPVIEVPQIEPRYPIVFTKTPHRL